MVEPRIFVVPGFTEAQNLSVVIPESVRQELTIGGHTRALVVDDGSTDATCTVIEALTSTHPGSLPRKWGETLTKRPPFIAVTHLTPALM